jgi:uncharacterized protein (DUF302 family)
VAPALAAQQPSRCWRNTPHGMMKKPEPLEGQPMTSGSGGDMQLDYTVRSNKDFAATVEAVTLATAAAGFKVQFVHDVAATIAEKGFQREPVTIIEVCNAKYASQVLAADVKIGLMLPCPIMVYAEGDAVFVSTMRPTLIAGFFPEAGVEDVASQVEAILTEVMDTAVAAN